MFNVYSASAGSGKTYRLTMEYLKLALGEGRQVKETDTFSGTYFRNILAITFTNAAANDMKERILREVSGIAQKDPKSDRFLAELTAELTGKKPAHPGFDRGSSGAMRTVIQVDTSPLFRFFRHHHRLLYATACDGLYRRVGPSLFV